jgi:hypothetical protein
MERITNPGVPRYMDDVEQDIKSQIAAGSWLVQYQRNPGDTVDLTYECDDSGVIKALRKKYSPKGIPRSVKKITLTVTGTGDWDIQEG